MKSVDKIPVLWRLAAVPILLIALVALLLPPSVKAAPTKLNTPTQDWVVSLGDSYISGEGGRWAGNEFGDFLRLSSTSSRADVLGKNAYWDSPGGESIRYCHRSRSAPIHIGNGVASMNFACSGSTTKSKVVEGVFKPGIDFYRNGSQIGQAQMLQDFASANRVKMVVLSVGGNDLNFGSIVEDCVMKFLAPSYLSGHCRNSSSENISEDRTAEVAANISEAISNIRVAMTEAGYEASEWTLAIQLYPQPLQRASETRYKEFGYSRSNIGGCPIRDRDLDWAVETLLPTVNRTVEQGLEQALAANPGLQAVVMDASEALHGRTLCHQDVFKIREQTMGWFFKTRIIGPLTMDVDRTEWVREIRILGTQDTIQESIHPNYWGQLALRNCIRQVWNGGIPVGGKCIRDGQTGRNRHGEPNMTLVR